MVQVPHNCPGCAKTFQVEVHYDGLDDIATIQTYECPYCFRELTDPECESIEEAVEADNPAGIKDSDEA